MDDRNYQNKRPVNDADFMNSPHAVRGGTSPLLMRQYTVMVLIIMRQYAETHNRICGRILKVTTTHAAVCGNSQPHVRQYTKRHYYTYGSVRKITTAYAV